MGQGSLEDKMQSSTSTCCTCAEGSSYLVGDVPHEGSLGVKQVLRNRIGVRSDSGSDLSSGVEVEMWSNKY